MYHSNNVKNSPPLSTTANNNTTIYYFYRSRADDMVVYHANVKHDGFTSGSTAVPNESGPLVSILVHESLDIRPYLKRIGGTRAAEGNTAVCQPLFNFAILYRGIYFSIILWRHKDIHNSASASSIETRDQDHDEHICSRLQVNRKSQPN